MGKVLVGLLALVWAIALLFAIALAAAYLLYTAGLLHFGQPAQIVVPPNWITAGATLAGMAVGIVGSYFVTLRHDQRRRREDARDVAVTMYLELADRAARCCYDFDHPWSAYLTGHQDVRKIKDVIKFRPTDPVMYPSIGAKFALLPEIARGEIVRFFSAQERLRRELDDIDPSQKPDVVDTGGCQRVARRVGESLLHARMALEALTAEVENWEEIDRQAFEGIYSTTARSDARRQRIGRDSLRETLAQLVKIVEKDKDCGST